MASGRAQPPCRCHNPGAIPERPLLTLLPLPLPVRPRLSVAAAAPCGCVTAPDASCPWIFSGRG
jgi:hypothetical protein